MKRLFSLILGICLVFGVAFIFVFNQKVEALNPEGLVAWYKFDDNYDDSSGNYYNGNDNNMAGFDNGLFGKAAIFNGTNSYIEVTDTESSLLDMGTAVTLEAWIYRFADSSNTGYQNIVRKGHQGDRSYGLDLYNGKLRGWVNQTQTAGGTAKIATGISPLEKEKWIHVAMIYDNTKVVIFLNGNSVGTSGSASGNLYDNNLSLRIGGQPSTDTGGAMAFKGMIDNVKIWNKALPINEVYDADHDGVPANIDKCKETAPTDDYLSIGVNRWIWDGNSWETTKSKGTGPSFNPDMDYTYGCSCNQILNRMVTSTEESFEGHFKYGCSKSILEDWNRGNYHVGLIPFETLDVSGTSNATISTTKNTNIGTQYQLTAIGQCLW